MRISFVLFFTLNFLRFIYLGCRDGSVGRVALLPSLAA